MNKLEYDDLIGQTKLAQWNVKEWIVFSRCEESVWCWGRMISALEVGLWVLWIVIPAYEEIKQYNRGNAQWATNTCYSNLKKNIKTHTNKNLTGEAIKYGGQRVSKCRHGCNRSLWHSSSTSCSGRLRWPVDSGYPLWDRCSSRSSTGRRPPASRARSLPDSQRWSCRWCCQGIHSRILWYSSMDSEGAVQWIPIWFDWCRHHSCCSLQSSWWRGTSRSCGWTSLVSQETRSTPNKPFGTHSLPYVPNWDWSRLRTHRSVVAEGMREERERNTWLLMVR